MNTHVIIPARYESTRLPGKPLMDLNGIPMVVRTHARCAQAHDPNKIFIATESQKIKTVCEQFGLNVILTSGKCLTGTDRVAEAANSLKSEFVINVQGDEPLFNPVDLKLLIESIADDPEHIINGYAPIFSDEMFFSHAVPKVVFDQEAFLLYMSRSPIPGNKSNVFCRGWRQICAYAFNRDHLQKFYDHGEKTPLENEEDIEILRFLELGMRVKMIPMSSQSIAVDVPEDAEKVRRVLSSNLRH